MDSLVTDKNHLDGRPDFAPSHWMENFEIFYLTQKMRCKDVKFSDLCDRLAVGEMTEEDENFLRSRIMDTPDENSNESFKNGKISIIVTTNKKKDIINSQKLETLLPYSKEYICNSVDYITNMPVGKVPSKLNKNPGQTGNLQAELKLKVGAPVLITCNHPKKKYKEDGLTNGTRGYVQSIQVSKQDPCKVEVVWVVFLDESVGKLYRHDYKHLRKHHNPGHPDAVPILPSRKTFKVKFGSAEYQRTNFPLTLGYAMTAHKCQGETLEIVVIDYSTDSEKGIRNYIVPGSFYVALTRVREGKNVFLKSYDKSYVQVNKKIAEKIIAMKKLKPYRFKKIYNDEKIFLKDNWEVKVGYLNINGVLDGNHADYLNKDHNLKCLDILVLSETKLTAATRKSDIERKLDDWNVSNRYDSGENIKHMGMLVLIGRNSTVINEIQYINHDGIMRNGNLQIQTLYVKLKSSSQEFGFVYSRSCPSVSEINILKKNFQNSHCIMGDLNLSHRLKEDKKKLDSLCENGKVSLLKEVTRRTSNNQLDYIIVDKKLTPSCFTTSFCNFISDHSSIVLRVGLENNILLSEVKEFLTFNSDFHLREKQKIQIQSESTTDEEFEDIENYNDMCVFNEMTNDSTQLKEKIAQFSRKFANEDVSSCWLNACLQLLLNGLENSASSNQFSSDLGLELLRLSSCNEEQTLSSLIVKHILVSAEDERVAIDISNLEATIDDQQTLQRKTKLAQDQRLDFNSGQQCARDFIFV